MSKRAFGKFNAKSVVALSLAFLAIFALISVFIGEAPQQHESTQQTVSNNNQDTSYLASLFSSGSKSTSSQPQRLLSLEERKQFIETTKPSVSPAEKKRAEKLQKIAQQNSITQTYQTQFRVPERIARRMGPDFPSGWTVRQPNLNPAALVDLSKRLKNGERFISRAPLIKESHYPR